VSQQELLTGVAAALDRHGIPYMFTGSVASSLYGEPRLTHDIDVIVRLTAEDAPRLADSFPPPRYYLDSADAIAEVVHEASMFNLVDTESGDKVDFWILTSSPFDEERFRRRVKVALFGVSVWLQSPEDVILSKLHWSALAGGSEKQFQDALRVFEVQRANLDLPYCLKWAGQLGVTPIWERLRAEAAR
jgi:hypothetical protein